MLDDAHRQVFPGGCFFAATSFEFNNRPGPVRDRIAEMIGAWLAYLERAIEQAKDAGELGTSTSARQIAFQLDAFAQAANASFQLFGDERVFDSTHAAARTRGSARASARPRAADPLPRRVVGDLVAADPADAEVARVRVREVEAADARRPATSRSSR